MLKFIGISFFIILSCNSPKRGKPQTVKSEFQVPIKFYSQGFNNLYSEIIEVEQSLDDEETQVIYKYKDFKSSSDTLRVHKSYFINSQKLALLGSRSFTVNAKKNLVHKFTYLTEYINPVVYISGYGLILWRSWGQGPSHIVEYNNIQNNKLLKLIKADSEFFEPYKMESNIDID